jgi:small subunit ribosomal protein S4
LLVLLETRLDNVVYRLGFASSRAEARQLVRHGHFAVNGRKVNIPSFRVKVGDIVALRAKNNDSVKIKEILEAAEDKTPPAWLERDVQNVAGRVLRLPTREDIDVPVEEHLIVELYSK